MPKWKLLLLHTIYGELEMGAKPWKILSAPVLHTSIVFAGAGRINKRQKHCNKYGSLQAYTELISCVNFSSNVEELTDTRVKKYCTCWYYVKWELIISCVRIGIWIRAHFWVGTDSGKCRIWLVFFSTDIVFKGSLLFGIFTQNSDKRETMLGAVQQYRTRLYNVYPR